MHFRERNRVVQVIRTVYDPATKKGQPEIVARLSKDEPAITDEMKATLKPEELAEVEKWVASWGERRNLLREHAVITLEEQLVRAAAWFRSQPVNENSMSHAAEVVKAVGRLQKQLRGQGLLPSRAAPEKGGRKVRATKKTRNAKPGAAPGDAIAG